MRLRGEQGLGIFDTLVVVILISILIVVLIPKYERVAREAQETALRSGLQNIRLAIGVYLIINHRYPKDLNELLTTKYILPVREDSFFSQEYLRSISLDAEGRPLDPFGNRYRYQRSTGHVASTTKGFEAW